MFLLQVVPLKVYELSMWMAHFNHPTPKRTILVSNSEQIAVLHRGRLSRSQKPASFPTAVNMSTVLVEFAIKEQHSSKVRSAMTSL